MKAIKEAKDDFGIEINPNTVDYEYMMRSIKREYFEEEIKNKPIMVASKMADSQIKNLNKFRGNNNGYSIYEI
ncbi:MULTISPECIES: hypothetical protein [Bacillus subtilis group]|uniref:hypothetical protein n=1 Tax=Bacillus TaxID=1386 RepID=UPI001CFB86C1|nr:MULTISPECIES: hypothetical protein [Bacillus subtilis group]MCB4338905.1 hypothetical protein [Bacillus subtilis]MCB5337211.1 hypothetical protein [Bacillus amyloliquefaciens]MCF7615532.1 hypothetical protein [Bacillus subtilis]MCL9628424.1 hypothetical protein [Bacillus subtilis]